MFDTDDAWLILFLLLYSAQEQGKELSFSDIFEQEKADTEFVKNCPSVEWEQDMHANIPFCKLDGKMCNMQCQNRNSYSSVYGGDMNDIRQLYGKENARI